MEHIRWTEKSITLRELADKLSIQKPTLGIFSSYF